MCLCPRYNSSQSSRLRPIQTMIKHCNAIGEKLKIKAYGNDKVCDPCMTSDKGM